MNYFMHIYGALKVSICIVRHKYYIKRGQREKYFFTHVFEPLPQKSIAPEPTQIPQEGEPLQSKGIVIKMTEEYMEKFNKLNLPDDLKILTYEQCRRLCGEIRDTLIKTVSENGGHLSSNLGAVELTLALHRVFSSPKDKSSIIYT